MVFTYESSPVICGLTTAKQRALATAASTAFPLSLRIDVPIVEHSLLSVATLPCGTTFKTIQNFIYILKV